MLANWRARIEIREHDVKFATWIYLRDENNRHRGRIQVMVGRLATTPIQWRAEKAAIDMADELGIVIESIDE